VIETVLLGLDRNRFPWFSEEREPTEREREAAVIASAALMSSSRAQTKRRTGANTAQENAVAAVLMDAGLRRVNARTIRSPDDWPARGEFCAESELAERKADLIVRLWDGRIMPIECKVSNSSTNSIKRLNNDAAVKATHWVTHVGRDHVVPVAMLSGVFKLRNLEQAQNRGLTIFWAHDLAKLTAFVEATRR
jgi:hypothetical protein